MGVSVGVLANNYGTEVLGEVNVEDVGDVGVGECLLNLLSVRAEGCHCTINS